MSFFKQASLQAFLDELRKIAAYANAMPPPATAMSALDGRVSMPAPRMPSNIPSEQAAFNAIHAPTAPANPNALPGHDRLMSMARGSQAPMPNNRSPAAFTATMPAHAPSPASIAAAGAPTRVPTAVPTGTAVPTLRPGSGTTLRVPGATGTLRPAASGVVRAAGTAEHAVATAAPGMLRRAAGAASHLHV